MNRSEFTQDFILQSAFRMDESLVRIEKCLEQLTFAEIWQRPNESLNSIGNLVLHLCGNMTQYILASLGGLPDNRARDEEFTSNPGLEGGELGGMIRTVILNCRAVLNDLDDKALLQERFVQGFRLSVTGIILHVVEHLSYHTGQITLWTKYLKNIDMGFYAGQDLNRKNQSGSRL